MKKTLLLSLLTITLVSTTAVQLVEIFENKQYGFSMPKPDDWFEADNKDLLKNLDKYELSDKELSKFIADHKGSVLLTSFYQYDPQTHAGLIPTIQVNVRNNPTKSFEKFKQSIIKSTEDFKVYFSDFEFETAPTVIEISGIQSVYFIGKFSMQSQFGDVFKVRSRTYAIPYKGYFFQLNFTDGQEKEQCAALFEELIKTIKVGK